MLWAQFRGWATFSCTEGVHTTLIKPLGYGRSLWKRRSCTECIVVGAFPVIYWQIQIKHRLPKHLIISAQSIYDSDFVVTCTYLLRPWIFCCHKLYSWHIGRKHAASSLCLMRDWCFVTIDSSILLPKIHTARFQSLLLGISAFVIPSLIFISIWFDKIIFDLSKPTDLYQCIIFVHNILEVILD